MSKLYTITIGQKVFEVRSTDVAQAVKLAIRTWRDGREEPKGLSLTVTASEAPAVREVTVIVSEAKTMREVTS